MVVEYEVIVQILEIDEDEPLALVGVNHESVWNSDVDDGADATELIDLSGDSRVYVEDIW